MSWRASSAAFRFPRSIEVSSRRKLAITSGIAIGLIVVGILVHDGRPLVLALPFLLYSAALLFLEEPSASLSLRIERRLDVSRIEEGEEIRVILSVENHGKAIPTVGLSDRLPAEATVSDGEKTYLGPLAEGGRITLRYTMHVGRGGYTLPGVDVTTYRRLALSPTRTFIACEDHFLVLPRAERLEEIEIRPRRTRAYAGIVRSNRGGSGLDFFGCRAYTTGDELRRINWRVYARRGELVVNEYEQERIADVSVLLDARERVNTHVGEEESFTYAVRAAASVASLFLKQGNNVGLLIYGSYLNWTFPGYGKKQREKILDSLAHAKTSDKEIFEDLRFVPTRLFPPQSQLILVSPLAGEDDVEVLGILRARGYEIILIVPDLLPLELEGLPSNEERDLARRIITLRRNLLLSTLSGIGVRVIDWDVTEPLSYPISWRLSRRGRRLG